MTRPSPGLLLVRHGRTEWNRLGIFQGTADVPLDAVGRRQADRLARTLSDRPLARVYSSPLLRARETAERILAARGSSVDLVVLDDLRELSYGLWQGKSPRQRALADPHLERCWRTEPWRARFPGGETLTQLLAARTTRSAASVRRVTTPPMRQSSSSPTATSSVRCCCACTSDRSGISGASTSRTPRCCAIPRRKP